MKATISLAVDSATLAFIHEAIERAARDQVAVTVTLKPNYPRYDDEGRPTVVPSPKRAR